MCPRIRPPARSPAPWVTPPRGPTPSAPSVPTVTATDPAPTDGRRAQHDEGEGGGAEKARTSPPCCHTHALLPVSPRSALSCTQTREDVGVPLPYVLVGHRVAVTAPGHEVPQVKAARAARAGERDGRAAYPAYLVARRAHPYPPSRDAGCVSGHEPRTAAPEPPGLGTPDGVVPVAGADPGVGNLMDNGLADLGLGIEGHEMAREGDTAAAVVAAPGATTGPVPGQVPVPDPVLVHEGARQGQDVGQIHGGRVTAGTRPRAGRRPRAGEPPLAWASVPTSGLAGDLSAASVPSRGRASQHGETGSDPGSVREQLACWWPTAPKFGLPRGRPLVRASLPSRGERTYPAADTGLEMRASPRVGEHAGT